MVTDDATRDWDGKLPRSTSQNIVIQVGGSDHTLKMVDPTAMYNARAVLAVRFEDEGASSGSEIAELYDTAMAQFIRHMTYGDVPIPHMRWDPPDIGLHQVTAYGLLTTSKENFRKYMTAKGAEGGAAGVGGGGGGMDGVEAADDQDESQDGYTSPDLEQRTRLQRPPDS